jgi:hypothetical protein
MQEAVNTNNEKVKLVSNCCKANAYTHYEEEGTNYYVCQNCELACDLVKQYEDANLDMFERFDKKFLSPRTLWAQDEEGHWYSKDDVRQFFKQEIENLLKEMIGEEVEDDYVCEYTSGAVFGANKKRENLINLATKHGFNVK